VSEYEAALDQADKEADGLKARYGEMWGDVGRYGEM